MTVGIGASLFLIATGAILAWAIEFSGDGVNLNMIGYILIAVGALGLLLSLFVFGPWGPYGRDRTVIHDRDSHHGHETHA